MKIRFYILLFLSAALLARAQGINWPTNQLLPTFSAPAAIIDCIDVSSATPAEIDLFSSLEGIVNRTQPRIACANNIDGEGKFTWLNLHNLPYVVAPNGYSLITKYQTNLNGLVVTDPNMPDTLNLATTIAGVSNVLICDPSLLVTLTNAPYNLPVVKDLRGLFSNKYQVYGYLYTNYWSQCTHRMITGLYTNIHGELRDYVVATKSALVWLDPGTLNFSDKSTLALFLNDMSPVNGIYMGWWPSEGNGLGWIAQYGIPVLASDYFQNASLYSGVTRPINVPDIPPPPPLANKIYVALILSDGDNIQYMQHVMKIDWDKTARGSVPISWTVSPLASEFDPAMLNHYWNTATTNDCLISGPSGAGYAHIESWGAANLSAFARISDSYLQRSGLRIITMWDSVPTGVARAFATNCQTLFGLTDQSGGNYTSINLGLRTLGLAAPYDSLTNDIITQINNAAAGWNGTSPMFLGAQAVVWSLGPDDLRNITTYFDPNKFVFVRADHLFMLYNQLYGNPVAVTRSATGAGAAAATLQGFVIPNAGAATAWFEWGTNTSYGTKTAVTNVAGASAVSVTSAVSGLSPRVIYHCRVAVSNSLGVVYGADKIFITGGRVKAWGDGSLGQTNVPAGLTNVIAVAGGASHALALRNDGTVVAWGNNNFKQTNVPPGLANVVEVSGGVQHSLALSSSGVVTAWGDNSQGQTNVPAGLSNVVEIAAGGYHNLALKSDGTIAMWGANNLNQTNMPPGLSNVVAIAAGKNHSLALKADGTLTSWGNNAFGQTNVPAGLSQVIGISGGDFHSLALRADGISAPNLFAANPAPAARWTADNLSGSDGTTVSNWTDTIRGKIAAQTSAGNCPLLYSNIFNGHGAVRFANANSQYLTVVAADSPVSGASDFTLAIVFKTSTPGLASGLFYQNTGLLGCEQPFAVADWALALNGSQLGGGLGAGGSDCSSDVSLYGGNVTDGKAHIAMYVRSGPTVRLYVDGVIVAAQTPLCTATRGTYDFQIGAMTTGTGFFNGDIAEVQVYNRALNIPEQATVNGTLATTYGVVGIAGAPKARWVADSISGADSTSIGTWKDALAARPATQTSAGNQPKLYSNAMNGHKVVRFSGASQYLTIAATNSPISAAGSFTLVMVFKTSTAGNSSPNFYLNTGLLATEQPGAVADWALCLNGSQLGAGLGAGANGCGSDLSLYGGNVTDGTPHIALYVRSGETITLYVDGVIVVTQTSLCPGARGDYPVQIGAMTTGLYYFNGDIAEIQMYDRALNSWEIARANENLAFTYGVGGSARTVVAWGNNGSGQTTVPAGLTNLNVTASGSAFNFALKNGGSLVGWGNNSSGQTNLLPGLTNVTAVAGGLSFGLAIGNQLPQVNSAIVNGYINHDLAFALPGVDPDGNPLTYRVLSLPVNGSLYQSSGGTHGTPISAPNTPVSDPSGQLIFAAVTNGTGNPYANLSFMAGDGFYNSGSAQVTFNIGLPSVPSFSDASGNFGGGNFGLNFSGSSNATYSVWASTNLTSWDWVGPATEAAPGHYQYLDATTTNYPQRFYRASAP
ncbi:MAG TPA: LamG-like jellyroll fold domain-containing protein [Candidatus Acidoferrales bacterium]|nr:LamG-like jellyroll fold domain-containing protein [Candidatus Acidoferrales bacterium]